MEINRNRNLFALLHTCSRIDKKGKFNKFPGGNIPRFEIGVPVPGHKNFSPCPGMGTDPRGISRSIVLHPNGCQNNFPRLDPIWVVLAPHSGDRNQQLRRIDGPRFDPDYPACDISSS